MTSDGFTIPEKAIIEHNLVAVATLYDNIALKELSILLGLHAAKAEKVILGHNDEHTSDLRAKYCERIGHSCLLG